MNDNLRVLVACQDKEKGISLQSIIAGNKNVKKVKLETTGIDTIKRIESWFPDIVFVDMNIEDFTGLEIIQHIRLKFIDYNKPIFILLVDKFEKGIIEISKDFKFYLDKYESHPYIVSDMIDSYINNYGDGKYVEKNYVEDIEKVDILIKLFNWIKSKFKRC